MAQICQLVFIIYVFWSRKGPVFFSSAGAAGGAGAAGVVLVTEYFQWIN